MLFRSSLTFGPILPIMKVKDEAEAICLANDSDFGLGGTVWSRDTSRAERVAHQMQASSVLINDVLVQFAVPSLPFGGVKKSGSGRTHGRLGLLEFTQSYAYAVSKSPHPFDLGTILRWPGNYQNTRAVMNLAFGATPRQRVKPIADALQSKVGDSTIRKATVTGLAGVALAFAFGLLWRTRK